MRDEIVQIVRGSLLVPREGGSVEYFADGVLAGDAGGTLQFVGEWGELVSRIPGLKSLPDRSPSSPTLPRGVPRERETEVRLASGVMLPPLVDLHIHIPQHPIRGRFVEGVPDDEPQGKLLAGLQKNVFPAEAKCHDAAVAQQVVNEFQRDTFSHGVVGGCAYMMVSPRATDIALATLGDLWSVGMVLMNQNSPDYLVTNEPTVERDIEELTRKYGSRCVVTDRFAVAVDSSLRRRASKLAAKLGLRTQTHLNEQPGEKRFVENELYPDAKSYTHVYLDDGLLDHRCILAHCIHMRDDEWSLVRDTGSVVAHCPTSNLLLGSGTMSLDAVKRFGIHYAIATDVGASPTVSMLAEMRRFLEVHRGRSDHATPVEALYRGTLAPARILGIADRVGDLSVGKPMSFIEVGPNSAAPAGSNRMAADVICSILPADLDSPAPDVQRVTIAGKTVFDRTVRDA